MLNLEQLNSQFAINNELSFMPGEGDHIMIDIDNQYAKARISPYGGQILSYLPKGQTEDLLFLSDNAIYRRGKAIRGGVPVCWPWFAGDESGFGRPAHGFARNVPWEVVETTQNSDGSTTVKLVLKNTDESLAIWPYYFELQVEITVADKLTVALTTQNTGSTPFEISQALHTYLNVGDIDRVSILGLDDIDYLDKLEEYQQKKQQGSVLFDKEVDRIYQNVPNTVVLVDEDLQREIKVTSSACSSTVVWNPWAETGANFSDLHENSYQQFVCIEAANVFDDSVTVQPHDSHTLTAIYEVTSG